MQSNNDRLFITDFVSKVANLTVLTNSQKENYGNRICISHIFFYIRHTKNLNTDKWMDFYGYIQLDNS